MKTQPLIESTTLGESLLDAENRQIHNVRLIQAGMSLNRRQYSMDTLAKAVPLFEGVKAYANHPDEWFGTTRSVLDITGWFTNVRAGADGIYGTRHFTKNRAGQDAYDMAADILTGKAPKSLFGLSINAVGKTTRAKDDVGNYDTVDEIVSVYSVDDVTTPAAGGTLLAAGVDDTFVSLFLKNITLEDLEEQRPDLISAFKKKWQAVRKEEALKTVMDENEQNAKLVQDLSLQLLAAEDKYNALVLKEQIATVLNSANLPPAFYEDLKTRLANTKPSEWSGIVQTEMSKAQTVGYTKPSLPRELEISVIKAGATTLKKPDYQAVETPEQHALYLRQVMEKQ